MDGHEGEGELGGEQFEGQVGGGGGAPSPFVPLTHHLLSRVAETPANGLHMLWVNREEGEGGACGEEIPGSLCLCGREPRPRAVKLQP